jgi:hypothetical protein
LHNQWPGLTGFAAEKTPLEKRPLKKIGRENVR